MKNTYKASLQTISKDTNITRQSCLNILNKLLEKKSIFKSNYTKDFSEYFINFDAVKNFDNEDVDVKKIDCTVKNLDNSVKKIDSTVKKIDGVHLINIYNNNLYIIYKYICDYLNEKAGTNYKHSTDKTKQKIKARLNEGFTINDFEKVIDTKVSEWKGTDFEKFLRPETLFGTKFESYLNQKFKKKKNEIPKDYQVDYLTPTVIVGDET